MLKHYLKLAIRNLLKYKTQTAVSTIGLAIGLACFTLAALWIRYEQTFDNFHQDTERICIVATDDRALGRERSYLTPYALGAYLKGNYSEVEEWCAFKNSSRFIRRDKTVEDIPAIVPDSSFLTMTGIKIVAGNQTFFHTAQRQTEVAVSEKMARRLWGSTDVIGRKLTVANAQKEWTVAAVVQDWPGHSNFPFSLMEAIDTEKYPWDNHLYRTLIKVKAGTDIAALEEKMNRHFPQEMVENRYGPTELTRFYLIPLSELRAQEDYQTHEERVVKSRYIVYFVWTGLLIIGCALANYLAVYVDRFRTRRREMALRRVCGATEGSLLALLATEQLLTVLAASFLSMVFVELLLAPFMAYSQITESRATLYHSCMLFVAGLAVVTFLITLVSVILMRRSSFSQALNGRGLSRIFRKGGIVVQLTVCLAFIADSVILQKQLHHLRRVDVGFEYANRGAFSLWIGEDMNVWAEKIKALPMIEEVVEPKYSPLVAMGAMMSANIHAWDGQEGALEKAIMFDEITAGEAYFRFYNIELLSGEWINKDSQRNEVNITESTARRLGWRPEEAVGKQLFTNGPNRQSRTVKGVVKDCAYNSPTADVPYTIFSNTDRYQWLWGRAFVLFKYRPGTWEACRERLEEMAQTEAPNKKLFLFSEEEQYNKFLASEAALSRLLGFASLVCVLIALFGIYSLVTLTCEQRRKEIAIRKVNGARVGDILAIFCKEYARMLLVASVIAFPLTYAVMQPWIESYNRQTAIGLAPFLGVFLGIALVIALSIGWRVWQAARQNPAEVVKRE